MDAETIIAGDEVVVKVVGREREDDGNEERLK
jgi:hypothetical protein